MILYVSHVNSYQLKIACKECCGHIVLGRLADWSRRCWLSNYINTSLHVSPAKEDILSRHITRRWQQRLIHRIMALNMWKQRLFVVDNFWFLCHRSCWRHELMRKNNKKTPTIWPKHETVDIHYSSRRMSNGCIGCVNGCSCSPPELHQI